MVSPYRLLLWHSLNITHISISHSLTDWLVYVEEIRLLQLPDNGVTLLTQVVEIFTMDLMALNSNSSDALCLRSLQETVKYEPCLWNHMSLEAQLSALYLQPTSCPTSKVIPDTAPSIISSTCSLQASSLIELPAAQ